ncbi:polyprenol monophosphomannose synthase [Candidatus Woesearchaeota archaeon]|nr:polyprenol monophosphomannose synthase [Candidatus Woesearchaeota archaeon]
MKKLSLILPTYNERENIIDVLNQLQRVLKQHPHEIIVVDDNSPDGTAALVKEYAQKHTRVKIVMRKNAKGLSSAVVFGFQHATGDILGVMDADGQHDAGKIPAMLKAAEEYEMVIGSRWVEGGKVEGWPLHRKLKSRVAALLAKCILGVSIRDPLSGFFLIQRKPYEQVKEELNPRGYKIMLELYARAKPKSVKEIGYTFRERKKGKSKVATMPMAIEYLKALLELRRQVGR